MPETTKGVTERRLSRRQFLRGITVTAGLAATAGILAACGGAAPTPAATTTSATTTSATVPTSGATAAPSSAAKTTAPVSAGTASAPAASPSRVGSPAATAGTSGRAPAGELKVSLPARIVALNPLAAQGAEESTRVAAQHIFDTLVVRDVDSGDYKPSLATKWETPTPTTWVFTLRSGVKFHDGTPLGAKDVKASLAYLVAKKGPLAPLWAALDTVETPDDTTVRITTKTPLGTVLANVALLAVAPADRVGQDAFYQKPVGSGPFKVASYKPDSELVLDANVDYWDGAPGVQTLRFRDIPELAARVTALTTGEIDFTYQLPPDQLETLKKDNNLTVAAKPSYRYYFIWFNAQKPAFKDKRVRQAMNYALDVKTILQTLMKDTAVPMDAPIPPTVFGYAAQTPYTYDAKKAKQLLADAGFANGFETDMIWNPGSGPQDREIAQAMLSYWSAIGVKVKDRGEERAQWLDDLLKLNWEMDFQTNGVVTGDADFVLRRLYTTAAKRNGYANADLDKILEDAAASVDQKKRADLYAQACKILWDDAVGIYPFTLVQAFVYRQRVKGFKETPSFPVFTRVTVS